MNHCFVVLYNLLSVKTCKKPASVIIYLYLSKKQKENWCYGSGKTLGETVMFFMHLVNIRQSMFFKSLMYLSIILFTDKLLILL